MQTLRKSYRFVFVLTFCVTPLFSLFADRVVLHDGQSLSGTVLRTNGVDILLLTDYGTLNYALTNIKGLVVEQAIPKKKATARIPDFKTVLLRLNKERWASNLTQIPATVIDSGQMQNVPYLSFRCGEDYEVNIYGDLDQPAAVEAGVYRKSARDPLAKSHCESFIRNLLPEDKDQTSVTKLNWEKDVKVSEGLTFEVTPPTEPDAYGGWWISVYSKSALDAARATETDLAQISAPKESEKSADASTWTATELSQARLSRPSHITFTNEFGTVITNAEVTQVNEGVSLDWQDRFGSGTVKLSRLSKELQALFGYDAAKAATVEATERETRARSAQQQREIQARIDAAQVSQAPPASASGFTRTTDASSYVTPSYSGGGRVYVRGYTRRDGTYVSAHTRSAPRRR